MRLSAKTLASRLYSLYIRDVEYCRNTMCGDYLKKKDKTIYNYILKETGIEISTLLEHLILNTTKIKTLNNIALEQIVNEFAPIYQKYR